MHEFSVIRDFLSSFIYTDMEPVLERVHLGRGINELEFDDAISLSEENLQSYGCSSIFPTGMCG